MKKAVVIGSSTGIGRALVKKLLDDGWSVGASSRYPEVLRGFKSENLRVRFLDLRDAESSMKAAGELIAELGGVDLFIFNAGILASNPGFEWKAELEGALVNAVGFQAMCQAALRFFEKQGRGNFVGISSIAAHRGTGRAPSYNASKAFMSVYMEGLRQRYYGSGISVTDIRPGFVETQMIRGKPGVFWSVSPEKAARDILEAARRRKKVAYVPARWFWIAQVFKMLPESWYHRAYQKYMMRHGSELAAAENLT